MTHLALPQQLQVDSLDLSTYAHMVSEVGPAFPRRRGDNLPRVGIRGDFYLGKVREAVVWTMKVLVLGTDANGSAAAGEQVQARINLDALLEVLHTSGQHTVTKTMPDASTRTATVEFDVDSVSDPTGNGWFFEVAVRCEQSDPRWYGASVSSGAQAFTAGLSSFNFTPGGNSPTSRITLDFLGPITGPYVSATWAGGGGFLSTGYVLPALSHLVINVDSFSAKVDGAPIALQVIHTSLGANWLELARTVNAITSGGSGTTGATRVTVSALPAYTDAS